MLILKTTSTFNVLHYVEDKFKQNNAEIQGKQKPRNHKPMAEDKSQAN